MEKYSYKNCYGLSKNYGKNGQLQTGIRTKIVMVYLRVGQRLELLGKSIRTKIVMVYLI